MPVVLQKKCPYCGKDFEVVQKYPKTPTRAHCSRSCAMKSSIKNRSGMDPWSEHELQLLQQWMGKKPLQQIIDEWNSIAVKKGWVERTATAIKVKFKRVARSCGKGARATDDNWSMRDLARLLDIPTDRIRCWCRRGLKRQDYSLSPDKIGRPAHYCRPHKTAIASSDLRWFAFGHPEEFWGIDLKRLTKVLGDSSLAKHIHSSIEQPTVGRAITVIRLDTGDVYRSTFEAATTLNIHKHIIRKVCQRDTPARNGMDFARIDYPVYWVPLAIRNEFNQLAGKLFYELYLELKDKAGYQKTSVQIVAGRMAVQICLMTFRKRMRQQELGEEQSPKEVIAAYWQQKFIDNINLFLSLDRQQGWQKLQGTIKAIAYKTFLHMLPASTSKQLQLHMEEYALHYIEKATKYFFSRSYLPKNYRPTNKLETADLFTFMYSLIFANIDLGEKGFIFLCRLWAMNWIQKHVYKPERSLDLSGAGIDEEGSDRAFHYKVQLAASTEQTCSSSRPPLLDELLEYMQSLPSITQKESDRACIYIDLKLEDCTDKEIAKTLSLSEREVIQIGQKLAALASRYQQKAIPGGAAC